METKDHLVCLRLFTTALKNLATELNIFILTSTQISNDTGEGFRDFKNIRGSKSIVDLCDFACIMSRPTVEELKMVSGFQESFGFQPNCVTDVFKNRRGRWTQVRIWSRNDLGICRKNDLFVTTPDSKPIEDFQIFDFVQEIDKEIEELEENLNGTKKVIVDYTTGSISNIKLPPAAASSTYEQEISEKIVKIEDCEKSFGNIKERVKKMNFEDLINF